MLLNEEFGTLKDYSSVELCLTEALYNVKDHSKCNGNAYYCIDIDRCNESVDIAVCDFGEGIPHTIKQIYPSFNDRQALCKALEDRFSTHSSEHNAGLGLTNIKAICTGEDSFLQIVSNSATIFATAEIFESDFLDFDFKGTLLHLRFKLSSLPDNDDTVCDFNW